jgi:hypothetical protein
MDAEDEGRITIYMVQRTRLRACNIAQSRVLEKLSVRRLLHHLPRFSSMTYPTHHTSRLLPWQITRIL